MASASPKAPSLEDEKPSTTRVSNSERGVVNPTLDPTTQKHQHHDPNWTGNDVDFSGVDEKKVLRKMDLRLIPVLAVLYLLSFLDRGMWLFYEGQFSEIN
jgi:hypothetical protein